MGYFPASYNQVRTVVPHASTNFDANLNNGLCDALYVGGAGVVVGVFQGGELGTFTCVAGQILPLRLKRVNAVDTTATLMIALYSI